MSGVFASDDPRPVHFLGISGAGMSGLALVALRRGVAVTGCDVDSSAFTDLRALGATLWNQPDPSHIQTVRAVVATAAAPDTHPEILAARRAGIPVIRRKQALAELVNGRTLAAIAGTHGKTTTTVMTTLAMTGAGMRPSALAGGRVDAWNGNASLDSDDVFVVEADEYDQAFLTLQPTVAVINNVEADHLECYGSVDAMEAAFATFAQGAEQVLIGNADQGSDRVAARLGRPVWRFGPGAHDIDLRVEERNANGSVAWCRFADGREVMLQLQVPGAHNLRNASAAVGVVAALGGDIEAAAAALAEFRGVGRRFERLGDADGISFVDDYAHHPTEMRTTLSAARQAFPGRRLVAVFQPHLYSRTRELGDAMGIELAAADIAVVTDVYGAREQPVAGVTGEIVRDAATRAGGEVIYVPDRAALNQQVDALLRDGDVVLTLGAGDVTRVGRELLAHRRAR